MVNFGWTIDEQPMVDENHVRRRERICPNPDNCDLENLAQARWDVNAPFETSGRTVLHQAVTFWTGSYQWDLTLRAAITSFLCEQGANPFQANKKGETPYDMASGSGHQDLLLILNRGAKRRELDDRLVGLSELSS